MSQFDSSRCIECLICSTKTLKLIFFSSVLQKCKNDLNAHTERMGELRKMVAQIAAEIGLDASDLLQGEVDALGKRLENVRESISVLADIAEARSQNEAECDRNIAAAKANLNEMQTVSSTFQTESETNFKYIFSPLLR